MVVELTGLEKQNKRLNPLTNSTGDPGSGLEVSQGYGQNGCEWYDMTWGDTDMPGLDAMYGERTKGSVENVEARNIKRVIAP